MAESNLALTIVDLKAKCARFAGWPTTSDDQTDDQTDILTDAVNSGCRRVYFPEPLEGELDSYSWSFMRPVSQLPLVIGTQSIRLPDDFGSFEGDITILTNATTVTAMPWKIKWVNEGRIRELYTTVPVITGPPMYVCPVPMRGTTGVAGQRFELLVFPQADQSYTLQATYYVNPDCLSGAFPYTLGGVQHSETFLESCLAIMEERLDDTRGIHAAAFQKRLAASISIDRRGRPQRIGYNGDGSDNEEWNRPNLHWYAPAATYNGASLG